MKTSREMGWSPGSGQDILKLGNSRTHLCAAGNDPAGREESPIVLRRGVGTQHGTGTLSLLCRRKGMEPGDSLELLGVLEAGSQPTCLQAEVRPLAERGKQGEKCDVVNLESNEECGGLGDPAADPRPPMWSGYLLL